MAPECFRQQHRLPLHKEGRTGPHLPDACPSLTMPVGRAAQARYDDAVTDPNPLPAQPPPPTPGERRLAHPPSDRYREAEAMRAAAAAATPDPAASVARGVALGVVVAILGAAAIVVLGGLVTMTAGLVVVAGVIGWGVAAGLRFGAGEHLRPDRRVVAAVVLALGAVGLGQLGVWQYARIEGGVLAPLDYLAEVFGLLVPLQFAVAAVVAWLAAR